MPNVWRSLVSWVEQHQKLADVLLMLVAMAMVVTTSLASEPQNTERAMDGVGWALAIASTLPIVLRRVRPIASLAVASLATFAFWIADYPSDNAVGLSLIVLAYSSAAHISSDRVARRVGFAFGIAVVAVAGAGLIWDGEDLSVINAIGIFLGTGTAWVLGDNARTHRAYVAEVEQRAERAESQRTAESERAIAQERTVIARELHDVVAHGLSVMVLQAAGARRIIDKDPEQASVALGAVEEAGRTSLNEMRRLLGVLRREEELEFQPQPSLHDLRPLVDQVRSAGLPVEVQVSGDVRSLPVGIELSAYRIVQESLTNAIKHAGAMATAEVCLGYQSDGLVVEVRDDGRGSAAAPWSEYGGQGLIGMRERVESIGGRFVAGPKPGGGYRVCAHLPLNGRISR